MNAIALLTKQIALIEQGRQALAEAKTIKQKKTIRDQAAVIEQFVKRQHGACGASVLAAELKLLAERDLGQMLAETVNHKGAAAKRNGLHNATRLPKGVTRTQSSRWQQAATVPEPEFKAYLETGKADGELTTAGVLRLAKERQREAQRQHNGELVNQGERLDSLTDKFPTIVADPPWDWGDEGDVDHFGRGKPPYKTMPFAEVAALPVAEKAAENSHLYLWITNRSLPKGFELLKAWGFRYITCLTWCKMSFGLGNYFRGSTEHVLFGVRGKLPLLRKDIGTWFEAERGKVHSSKPRMFYELVEQCSPGPWLELFSRSRRNGWTCWGAETDGDVL